MHTITLKSDDIFFDILNDMVKTLNITKSELIKNAVIYYKDVIEQEKLKSQIEQASQKVRDNSLKIFQEFEDSINDGL